VAIALEDGEEHLQGLRIVLDDQDAHRATVLDDPDEDLVRDEAAPIGQRDAFAAPLDDPGAIESLECGIDPRARSCPEARAVRDKIQPFVEPQ